MSGSIITLLKSKFKGSGMSRATLAKVSGTSPGQLSRVLSPEYLGNVKLLSLQRVAWALGFEIEFSLKPLKIEPPQPEEVPTEKDWPELKNIEATVDEYFEIGSEGYVSLKVEKAVDLYTSEGSEIAEEYIRAIFEEPEWEGIPIGMKRTIYNKISRGLEGRVSRLNHS